MRGCYSGILGHGSEEGGERSVAGVCSGHGGAVWARRGRRGLQGDEQMNDLGKGRGEDHVFCFQVGTRFQPSVRPWGRCGIIRVE